MSLMTEIEIDVLWADYGLAGIARAIESIAHERGRQQGLMEAAEIAEQLLDAGEPDGIEAAIRAHAAKGPSA